MLKYIFITGGVTSSLGKGILAASLGKLLQARGYRVTIQKLDPYLNVDPGTLNPYEHGECYVTDDGAETDLDLGHYERFLNQPTSRLNNVTAGQVFLSVINKEREGAYLGKTVQMIPHITDEIKRRIKELGESGEFDIVIVEIGGTVGDIEAQPFIEAIRQLRWELGQDNTAFVHLTLLPYLRSAGELKTKPTQHSVRTLQSSGIQPDVIACRTEIPLQKNIREKIALFCNVEPQAVIEAIDVDSIYDVPVQMLKEQLDVVVLNKLKLPLKQDPPEMSEWFDFLKRLKDPSREITIGLVGKYVELKDAYISIREAFIHAGAFHNVKVNLKYIHSEHITEDNVGKLLKDLDGVLVAPGFGKRGIEGKITAIKYVRERGIPFFGICLGMQCAVIEFARNVLGMEGANSTEFDPDTPYPVIDLMEEQKKITRKGGTMRLGAYPCYISDESSIAFNAYKKHLIYERHRHRYEVNNQFVDSLKSKGLIPSGINPETNLVEMVELEGHPWFVGVQFHPEYKSTVANPHPLFKSFVEAAIKYSKEKAKKVEVS